jgi:hypothetical protein
MPGFLENGSSKLTGDTLSGITSFFPKKIYAAAQVFILKLVLFDFACALNKLVCVGQPEWINGVFYFIIFVDNIKSNLDSENQGFSGRRILQNQSFNSLSLNLSKFKARTKNKINN